MPVPNTRRSLAPDLARGFMLLFIALVNARFFLTHDDTVRDLGDRLLTLVQLVLVDGRAIPLFSLLFGYGAVWIARRVTEAGGGRVHVRTVLRRRGLWLLLFGLAHGVLLLPVDILGAYGLALLLFTGFLWARDRTLLWSAGVFAVLSLTLNVLLSVSEAAGEGDTAISGGSEVSATAVPSLVEPGFVAACIERFQEWTLYTPVTLLLVVLPPLLLGVWAGRRRVLERPEEHRRPLVITAVVGLGVAVIAGLPDGLVSAGLLPTPDPVVEVLLWIAHDAAGWAGGPGWAALITLLALRLNTGGPTDHPLVTAITAVGERSMSCYLFQAVIFTLVFAPYGLGWGATASVSTAALVAVGTWGTTVVAAFLCRRAGLRGPAEALLRRLVYSGVHLSGPARETDPSGPR